MDTAGVDDRSATDATAMSPTELAQQLLVACRRDEATEPYTDALAELTDEELTDVRTDRETALAFWLNCYNAGTQTLLDERPELYDSPLRFLRFFRAPAINVGGAALPLDRIENGILRGGLSKYGLGYVPKIVTTSFEREYRLADCDPRTHFALNCGAASCPPIRAYDPENVDEQLDVATRGYLESTVEYDAERDLARVPRVFLWFYGDFGGHSGTRAFLKEYDIVPADASPSIRYLSWDWSKAPKKFVE